MAAVVSPRAEASRRSNGLRTGDSGRGSDAWSGPVGRRRNDRDRVCGPCPTLAFINKNSGAPDVKHDQDLRDTCVMLLDAADNDILSICDVIGHSYQSAQLIMKHYRARNAARADAAIDRLVEFISRGGVV